MTSARAHGGTRSRRYHTPHAYTRNHTRTCSSSGATPSPSAFARSDRSRATSNGVAAATAAAFRPPPPLPPPPPPPPPSPLPPSLAFVLPMAPPRALRGRPSSVSSCRRADVHVSGARPATVASHTVKKAGEKQSRYKDTIAPCSSSNAAHARARHARARTCESTRSAFFSARPPVPRS